MAFERKDRVSDTTATTGTGTLTLSGVAQVGYRSFSSAHTSGATVRYAISRGAEWEVGEGIYTASGNTLTRTTVLASSNSGSLVNFSAGTKTVVSTLTAGEVDKFVLAETDPLTGGIEEYAAGEKINRNSYRRNRIVSYGSKLIDTTISTGWTRSGAGTVYTVTPEMSRRSSFALKVDMTSASADAILEWSNATGIALDPDDQLIAFDLYIPDPVQTGINGGGVSIGVFLSNTTSYSAPGHTFTFNSNYLKQGWNEIRLCGLDADGSTGNYRGAGTLPFGVNKTGAGGGANPLVWTSPIKFIQIQITNASSRPRKYYLDSEIRIPEKIKPFLCVGFDASGSSMTDDIFLDKTAPFLAANNVPCYFTNTWIYDGILIGSQDDDRRNTLYNDYKWDAINHTWSHGASVPGALYSSGNTLVVSGTGTLATITLNTAHGWTIGTRVLVAVWGATGASGTNVNGVFVATVTTTTAITYAITGGTDGTATGTTQVSTRLNSVINGDPWTNQPIVLSDAALTRVLEHEIIDLNSYGNSKGWVRGGNVLAYPNSSFPSLKFVEPVAKLAGITVGRAFQGTTAKVSSFGFDNPLCVGSFELASGTNGSTLADATNALQGAINRGEGLFIFGHFLRDEALDAVVDINSPPGLNGNPAAPGASPALWWYEGQFENFIADVAMPLVSSGELDFLSASEVAEQIQGVEK